MGNKVGTGQTVRGAFEIAESSGSNTGSGARVTGLHSNSITYWPHVHEKVI